jgi:hypothetical protein
MKWPRLNNLLMTVSLAAALTPNGASAQSRQPSDLRVCNDSGVRAAVTMVRTTGMFGGTTKGNWQAEGPFLIPVDQCQDIHFGAMQALQQGYLSIQLARKTAGAESWSAPQYRVGLADRDDKNQGPRFEVLSPLVTMCLPYATTPVVTPLGADPLSAKPPCRQGWGPAPFNVWFFTHGEATKFAITLTEAGFSQSVNVRSQR